MISVLTELLNKLQVDQYTSELSQKTLPISDPAAIVQLSTELFAQASQLSIHQHQLDRLTSLMEDLVRSLQGLNLQHATQPTTAPPTLSHSPENPINTVLDWLSQRNSTSPPTDARASYYNALCSSIKNPFPTDTSKIAFVCSLLTGKALDWITPVWRSDGTSFHSFDHFMQ